MRHTRGVVALIAAVFLGWVLVTSAQPAAASQPPLARRDNRGSSWQGPGPAAAGGRALVLSRRARPVAPIPRWRRTAQRA